MDVVSTFLYGAIGIALVVEIILAVQGFFFAYEQKELERKVVERPYQELVTLRAQQEKLLHSYRMLDPETGRVAIPIERAMELTLQELEAGRPEDAR